MKEWCIPETFFSEINNRQNLNAIVTRIVKKELLTFLISIFENGDFCILIIQCTGKHQSNTRKAPAYARNTLANDTIAVPTVIDLAVLEFVAVGTDCKAFLSSSVKGGERHTVTSVRKTTLCLCYARSAFLWQITSFLARIGDIHTRRNDVFLPSCVCRQRNRTLQNALNMDDEQHNDHSVRSHLFHNPLDSKPL